MRRKNIKIRYCERRKHKFCHIMICFLNHFFSIMCLFCFFVWLVGVFGTVLFAFSSTVYVNVVVWVWNFKLHVKKSKIKQSFPIFFSDSIFIQYLFFIMIHLFILFMKLLSGKTHIPAKKFNSCVDTLSPQIIKVLD